MHYSCHLFFSSQENPADPTKDPPGGGRELQGGTLVHLVEETTPDGGLLRAADDTGSNRTGQLPRVMLLSRCSMRVNTKNTPAGIVLHNLLS